MKTLALIFSLSATVVFAQQPVRVGAKHFTEGYILSEIIAQVLESKGIAVTRVYNLGGTLVCFEALKNGEIDIYPEYTGTISQEILKLENNPAPEQLHGILQAKYGLEIGRSFGFNNTYALVVTTRIATSHGLKVISDLIKFPDLTVGLSYEFLKRQDGWDRLAKVYTLPHKPTGLEHGLAYQALLQNEIAVTDAYSTDAEISSNSLTVLQDDKNFFPSYEPVPIYRPNPDIKKALGETDLSITEEEMSALNALAVYKKIPFDQIARHFLVTKGLIHKNKASSNTSFNYRELASKTLQHLFLTFTALVLAIAFALPLGILLYWNPRGANITLYIAGLLQTIPSIAMLAIMIPVFGIGALPAIVALFLYAILPILRNTVSGLRNVDPLLKEIAASLGMSRGQSLRYVEFPLALSPVLTGIRIAAVINVGTATLAAFIGAGGLGEYIVTGLALNNTSMILTGAVPAALLALVIELTFEVIERRAVPAHLRKNS
ncbi:MAG TPA: glycine betaine ABC transporter substrate-binding protein [Cyclobacteriaceae bacterium]|nr:glycine betaine ABC transporter substrate-binding protein [Cyclobacteriaceae bacterium]